MIKTKTTKRALLLSVLSMMLCLSMLVGSTFAWFTDSVTSGVNKIVAGNLDVELEYAVFDEEGNVTWKSVQDETLFDENALWEPGYTQVVYLKVSNAGTLALKYKLSVNVADETVGVNVEGKELRLSEHLVFGQVESKELTTYATREDAWEAVGSTKGLNNYTKNSKLAAGAEEYVALVVYMPTTVGNEANYRGDAIPTIELGISLVATQDMVEEDGFGNDYDDVAMVATVEELKDALSKGTQNVVLTENMEISETINITKDVNLDLNGTTLTNNASASRIFFVTEPNVTLTIDGTKEGSGILASDAADGKTYGIVDMRIGSAGSKLVVNGGTYTANTDNGALFKVRDDNVAVELNNVTATTNRRIFDSYNVGTTLTVNGGHFTSTETVNGSSFSVFYFSSIPVDYDKPNISFTDTTIVSAGGACIDLNCGIGEFNNCNFTVTNASNPAHTASAIGVSNGSWAFINGGTYTSEGYGAYVYTSGGNIVIDGGAVITGKAKALACSAASYYYEDGQITVNDGTINGDIYAYNDGDRPADITINGGSVNGSFSTKGSASATIHIYCGLFTENPTDYIDDSANTYVTENGDGTWSVATLDEEDFEDPFGE